MNKDTIKNSSKKEKETKLENNLPKELQEKCKKSIGHNILSLPGIFIWIGIMLVVSFWIIESLMHEFIFDKGTFIEKLFTSDPHELWMRLVITSLFITFGFLAQFIISRLKKTQKNLDRYRLHLEDMVNERIAQLKGTNEQLQQEITERKLAERLIKCAYGELDQIFNTSADGMIVIDKEFKILRVNETFCKLFNITNDGVVGKNCYDVIHHSLCNTPRCPLFNIINGEQHFETEIYCKDWTKRFYILTANPFRSLDGELIGTVENFKDITERKKIEEEMQKGQKLESIGILAGGIAHDYNNLLTVIIGNLSLGKMYTKPGSNILEVLTEIEKASRQAKKLTQQLITFSRGGGPIKKIASISDLFQDTAVFALSGSNVKSKFSLPQDLWRVEMDAGQMSQAISNLLINAKEAMPEGGAIRIRAENIMLKKEDGLPLKDGKYVKVSVKDQGVGIPKEHLSKVFDPYFTTKDGGHGLNLAITFSIIKRHGGYITVESEVGVGTTFTIYLAACEKEIFTEKKIVKVKPHVGKAKILVMDDQQSVRKVAKRILTHLGYEVELACDGAEVVELYKSALEAGHTFDAVILDLTVAGGIGGKEAIKKLIKINPNVKAIVSSGYSNDPIISEYVKYGFRGVVTKPYEIQELSEVLHQIIAGTTGTKEAVT